ncbi:MAG TPA: cobalamin B12-binding domain-containing protein [Burkholderiaceae bacterium]|nr:cobalamin B12-binding domain-containing protein [Burkholderiaceae bacterium]
MRSDHDAERDRGSGGIDWMGRDAVAEEAVEPRMSPRPPPAAHHGRLIQAIHTELIPRLLRNQQAPGAHFISPGRQHGRCAAAAVGLAQATLRNDEAAALSLIDELLEGGIAIEQVFLDVLSPAAQRLGAMWESDSCSFADVTLGLWRIQKLLFDLSARFRAEAREHVNPEIEGRCILLAAAPDGQHTFGLSMLGEFFARAGWSVAQLMEPSRRELLQAVKGQWLDVLGLSVGSEQQIDRLGSVIVALRRAARNPHLVVMVGGAAFAHHPEYAALVGADCMGSDARSALSAAADRVLAQEHRC